MLAQVSGRNGISTIPTESILLSKRKIFIEGEITSALACDFMKSIMFLEMEDTSSPIDVIINSPGGEINAGLMMYDIMGGCKSPIRTFCAGKAFSMAAVLFAAGTDGRYMLPYSELMLHEPLLGGDVCGNSSSIKSISDSLIERKKMMNKIISKHTGKTEKEVEKNTSYDHYFNAKESVNFGLCDEIISFDKFMEVC